jgi:hypothetical protein
MCAQCLCETKYGHIDNIPDAVFSSGAFDRLESSGALAILAQRMYPSLSHLDDDMLRELIR